MYCSTLLHMLQNTNWMYVVVRLLDKPTFQRYVKKIHSSSCKIPPFELLSTIFPMVWLISYFLHRDHYPHNIGKWDEPLLLISFSAKAKYMLHVFLLKKKQSKVVRFSHKIDARCDGLSKILKVLSVEVGTVNQGSF